MSIQTTKALLWVGSLGLFGGLGYTVYTHLDTREVDAKELQPEDYEPYLKEVVKPEPPKDHLVDYDQVLATFHQLDWSGKEKPKPEPERTGPEVPVEKPKVQVETLATVLMTQVDSRTAASSTAYLDLQYALEPALPNGEKRLVFTVGETLPKPHDTIKLESIGPGTVTFSFIDDEEREHETLDVLTAGDDIEWIVKLGPDDQVAEPEPVGTVIPKTNEVFSPRRTYVRKSGLREKEYQIGTEDRAIWAEKYSDILANDVAYKRYRDPRTGKVTGVEITSVKSGSMAASHGVESGQIIKSVNGHAVTSVSDAVSYARQNADTTSTWIIVYEQYGKQYTTTYQSE